MVSIYCVKYDKIKIASNLCDWEAACLITVYISREVGDCHIDMEFLSLVLVCSTGVMESSFLVMVVCFVERVPWRFWSMRPISVSVVTLM